MIRTPTPWLIYGSFAFALLFAIIPLPEMASAARPWLLAMLLAYWIMEAPSKVGMGSAFLIGLLGDVLGASLLGEQALRLVIMTFILQRFRARLRFFPLWQQALAIGALLLNDRVVSAVVHTALGTPQLPWAFWWAPLLGLLLWAPIFLMLDTLRFGRRG